MNTNADNATLSAQIVKLKNRTAYIGRADYNGKTLKTTAQPTYYKAVQEAKRMVDAFVVAKNEKFSKSNEIFETAAKTKDCKNCGKPFCVPKKGQHKLFCKDDCRYSFYKKNNPVTEKSGISEANHHIDTDEANNEKYLCASIKIEIMGDDLWEFSFESLHGKATYILCGSEYINNLISKIGKYAFQEAFCKMLAKYLCIVDFYNPLFFESKLDYEKAKVISGENSEKTPVFIYENGKFIPIGWNLPII
jgi:hypothetical protein